MSTPTSSLDHDHESSSREPRAAGGAGVAPGKQTLTARLPSLRGRERDVARFDAVGEYRESRATIAGPPGGHLDDHQLRKARHRNPYWHERLGFAVAAFGGGGLATAELAQNVAARQAEHGLAVDGIAGPETVAAVGAKPASGDRTAAASAIDDPFGMHLLG